ncbi:MAG: iron uptake porin [Symploca sp. SIO2E6]|nr:iron uptake porin [Symploca sp. SIO2E6]
MNKYQLSPGSGVGLLCLLAGYLSFGIVPAAAEVTEQSGLNLPETTEDYSNQLTELTSPSHPQSPISISLQSDLDTSVSESAASPSVSELLTQIDTESEPMGQITSVSELSDVQPSDWAYEALRSLVERYGVISGYPDGTFRGNRPLSRYEFAAGLNAALDRVSELIANGNVIDTEDLIALERLQAEFAEELSILESRVDNLEARTVNLENQQFSTTTKLSGEVIFSLAGATGAAPGASDAEVVFNNRVRLNLNTSFTGKDLLITGLQAHNFGGGFGNTTGSIPGTLGYGDPLFGTASNVSLGFAPQFGFTNPQTLTNTSSNDVNLYKLLYIFPVADRVTLFAGTNAEVSDAFPAITPFAGEGQEAVSRFAGLNPVTRVSGGTSQTGLASAVGAIWSISDQVDLRALYGSVNASLPNDQGLAGGTILGAGLFDGSNVIAAQLTVKPTDNLDIGLNYAHSRHDINILATGLSSSDIGSVLFTPNATQLAAVGGSNLLAVANEPIRINSFGGTLSWRITPQIAFTSFGSVMLADLENVDASTDFTSWMAGLHFKDLLKTGNTAGLLFGQPLTRSSVGGSAQEPEDATPYHLEAYFKFQVSDNISITPGVYFIFNPEGSSQNDTATVGVIRTTFTF